MPAFIKYLKTPIGEMICVATEEGICVFDYAHRRMIGSILNRVKARVGEELREEDHSHFIALEKQLKEYFAGTRKDFNLPIHLIGTDFQLRVWRGLLQIPYGETRSYKKQSIFLGDEKAIRAVARANGENGLAIIIPCHRVIGENGSLTGYAGGLRAKQWLLDHERRHAGYALQQQLF
jgi:AraC family transcriptional regulator of adaptative response/methylated-DNA-[protein]-cysteine methyltransferase